MEESKKPRLGAKPAGQDAPPTENDMVKTPSTLLFKRNGIMRYSTGKQNPNKDNTQMALMPDDSLQFEKKISEIRSTRRWRKGIRWLGKTENSEKPYAQKIFSSFNFALSTE